MKIKAITLTALLLFSLPTVAADEVLKTFQQALFEEEANQNLEAAIEGYQRVLDQLDQQRKLAATTLFRLGECYRKQGQTNLAAAQFERVAREFPDQTTLATLSRQNLAALGQSTEPARTDLPPDSNQEAEEIQRLRGMIQNSPDLINAPGKDGLTPLQSAAAQGQVAVARFLIENGAELDRKAPGGTALHDAAQNGHKAIVELLLASGADVNAQDSLRKNALWVAAANGFNAVAEVLLASGADPNQVGSGRYQIHGSSSFVSIHGTPLHAAVDRGFEATVRLLLENGADINRKGSVGRTPLHFAANRNLDSMIKLLLNEGADPNSGDHAGLVPLHLAVDLQQREIARLLLDEGADMDLQDHMGRTVLHMAIGSQQSRPIVVPPRSSIPRTATTETPSMLELLLQYEPNLELRNADNFTPLQFALNTRNIPAMELLLRAGTDPNAPFPDGRKPLHMAADYETAKAAVLLIRHKADLNAPDNGLNTPLHAATRRLNQPMVELLLEHGADVNAKNQADLTPLDLARWGHVEPFRHAPPGVTVDFSPADSENTRRIENLLRKHGGKPGQHRLMIYYPSGVSGSGAGSTGTHLWGPGHIKTLGEVINEKWWEYSKARIMRKDPETGREELVKEVNLQEIKRGELPPELARFELLDGDRIEFLPRAR